MEKKEERTEISKTRFILGTIVFVLGFLSPLLIPFVTESELSTTYKTALSGLLAFGIPEIFILLAVAILGKEGYAFLKSKIGSYLKPFAPADEVSLIRYRIGLVFFCVPLLVGWISPYLLAHFPQVGEIPISYYIIGDLLFVSSFFILGGNFWDKFRNLFSHDS